MLDTPKKQTPRGKEKGQKGIPLGKQGKRQDKSTPRRSETNPAKEGDAKRSKKQKVRLKHEPEIIQEETEVRKPALIFPGLINEATRLSLSSPLREALELFYLDMGHVPEETILNIRQEFEDVLPHILKKLTKVKSFLKFTTPVVPDFTGNDVITDGDLDILLPFKPPAYKEEHLEPGYMTVIVGGGKKRDLDEEESGTMETYKKHLTSDAVHVSPINVCQVLNDGLLPPPPKKKKGKRKKKSQIESPSCPTPSVKDVNIAADDTKDGRSSGASFLDDVANDGRVSSKMVNVETPRGGDISRATNKGAVTPQTDRSNGTDLPMGEGDMLYDIKEGSSGSRNEDRQSPPQGEAQGTQSANGMVNGEVGSRPPSNPRVGSGVPPIQTEDAEGDAALETGRRTIGDIEEVPALTLQPFVVDECGANVIITYESLRIRLVPCIAVRPGDEAAEHDFLVSKPFEHDENAQSHMLWRQSCLTRERVITRSMTLADGGVRLKVLRTMIAFAKIDPGLDGLSPYIIKTALLNNFDNTIDVTPRWQRNNIENCFIPLLKDLSSAFNSKRLPHFFLKDFNVLDGIHPNVYARVRSRLALLASSDAALIRALQRR